MYSSNHKMFKMHKISIIFFKLVMMFKLQINYYVMAVQIALIAKMITALHAHPNTMLVC